MIKRMSGVGLAILLAACGGATAVPDEVADQVVLEGAMADVSDGSPYDVTFESADGTLLSGRVYPANGDSAPGILLMHWLPGSQADWDDFIAFVQQNGDAEYAFMTFDFRGHGGSEGSRNDRAGYIADAQAALAFFREQPGVDADRIVHIGASIGSDAAVDGCGEGCVGVVSLSPGSFTGMDYSEALGRLGDRPVLCVAALDDGPSPATCEDGQTVGLANYTYHLYEGGEHAMEMFGIDDQTPLLYDLLLEWLNDHHA